MQPAEQRDEVEMLWLMLLIRRFEERASQQYQAQKIGGFCHLYIGQEAVVTGAVAAMRHDDYIITAYRDHAHALARGTSANACMAELFGKETGCSRGLGGSMHYFDKRTSHVRRTRHRRRPCPAGVGMAFASKYRSEDRVTLCFFGDGAINQGAFHEALNLAALFKLPVIFICENNLFAMGTSVERSTSLKQIVDRAEGYDIPGGVVDGMNFREVRDKLERDGRIHSQGSASGVCRSAHLSLSRPFHVGPGELSNEGGTGEISAGRSDHAVARATHARRKTDERKI